jgi:DNA-binding transcriptional LysR family regulator
METNTASMQKRQGTRMEIRQLNSFVKIVEMQSFSKAAEALGYTQAAVTIQIRQLEQEFNMRFFDRVGRHVVLTPPGREFLNYAHEILRRVDDVHTALGNPKLQEHRLRVGTLESLLSFKLPEVITYFYENHPEVTLEAATGSPKELIDMLEHNLVDVVYLLDRRIYDNNWVKVLEEAEPIVFVASPDTSIARQSTVRLPDLIGKPFFLTEQNSNYRYALEQLLAAEHMQILPFFETGDTEVIIRLIEKNRALSFLPLFAVRQAIAEGRLVQLKVEDFSMTMYRQVFYHKDKWMTEEMKQFVRLTKLGML